VHVSRENELVELVDRDGRAIGESTVEDAHREPGLLHRAFSVLLVDPAGRLLLQQRAAVKTRFPLRWANACCGHPGPGEAVGTAARRRLTEEVGLRAVPLTEIGVYVYRAHDEKTGRVEHEYDHVLIGEVTEHAPLDLDPAEVAAVQWIPPGALRDDIDARPGYYAPWLAGVTQRLLAWPGFQREIHLR
jgi:isopentenyl-diphosphate delta-isomerase